MSFKQKYGEVAIVAGASEGIGAAFSRYLAAQGMELILIARRQEVLIPFAEKLRKEFGVKVDCLSIDLSNADASAEIMLALDGIEADVLVYNAALSFIGPFEKNSLEDHDRLVRVNMTTPMNLVQELSKSMLHKKRGAIILMASLAGFQGSGFLSAYAASKAFNRVLAESLWYEWKDKGVAVIACCAGATATPNFNNTQPEKKSFFAPRVQKPEEVVRECMQQLGKKPSYITGRGNRIATFIMQKLMPRKSAVTIMGDTTRKMYRL